MAVRKRATTSVGRAGIVMGGNAARRREAGLILTAGLFGPSEVLRPNAGASSGRGVPSRSLQRTCLRKNAVAKPRISTPYTSMIAASSRSSAQPTPLRKMPRTTVM
jgi:hypothetical protein